MRIAFFTPLSPQQSALSDYGEGLALGLSQQPGITVDLFVGDEVQPDNPVIVDKFRIDSYRTFPARAAQYDVCLYSMGDHALYHGYMLELLRRYPGVVILNDLVLHRCVLYTARQTNNMAMYLDELENAYGLRDPRIAKQIQGGLDEFALLDYPLFEGVVTNSLGVIVQNQYAYRRVVARRPQTQVACISYPFFMPPGFSDEVGIEARQRRRMELGVSDQLVIGSFGIFAPSKQMESCLAAFARLLRRHPQSKYLLGGMPVKGYKGYDLAGQIDKMGLTDHVMLTGWQPPVQFARDMLALDIGIHLRYPHIGGTPYTPIRLMGTSVCTITSDIEPLAELPQGACIKIVPDACQTATLAETLNYLADNPEFLQLVSTNGREFIAMHHSLEQISRAIIDFLKQVKAKY